MSAGIQSRSAVRGARSQSLFYRDLGASPATRASGGRGGDVGVPNQATAALWRENVGGGVDPPPPPFYTLEDRIERSPESTTDLSFRSPDQKLAEKNLSFNRTTHSPPSGRGGYGTPFGESQGVQDSPATPRQAQVPGTNSWWSPLRERRAANIDDADTEGSSPVSGVVQQQPGLLTLSTPREIIRPGLSAAGATDKGTEDEEWVTIFGFGVDETNSVMREFEKCGPIIDHVSGPGGANWVHLKYQNSYDAQKALQKNGIQLNRALIVGVKRLDPLQLHALTEKVKRVGLSFTSLPPRTPVRGTPKAVQSSAWSFNKQPAEAGGVIPRPLSVVASPAKSTLSKLVDLVFGM